MKIYEYWNDRKWVKVIFHGVSQSSSIVPTVIIEDEKGLHEVEVWRIREVQG